MKNKTSTQRSRLINRPSMLSGSHDLSGTINKTLLIVDDDPSVLRLLKRVVVDSFKDVFVATNAAEAEKTLQDHPISIVVCDYDLGASEPRGTDLIRRWRSIFPSISRAVIFTGSDISQITVPPEVDSIFSKGNLKQQLLNEVRED